MRWIHITTGFLRSFLGLSSSLAGVENVLWSIVSTLSVSFIIKHTLRVTSSILMTSQQTKKVQYGINVGVAININIILSDYGLYTLLIKCGVCPGGRSFFLHSVTCFSLSSHCRTHTLQQNAALWTFPALTPNVAKPRPLFHKDSHSLYPATDCSDDTPVTFSFLSVTQNGSWAVRSQR